jgi:hypothetical protein
MCFFFAVVLMGQSEYNRMGMDCSQMGAILQVTYLMMVRTARSDHNSNEVRCSGANRPFPCSEPLAHDDNHHSVSLHLVRPADTGTGKSIAGLAR